MDGENFRRSLLIWNEQVNEREMPWKGERDPYKIWLSEIILQQTRVQQGMAYYLRFTQQYPTIHDLAAAPDEAVFKLWEGLGYYSRCRNLLSAARSIVGQFDGVFPSSYEQILSLAGVGSYTAAAIASFAFNQPYAVLDGNVYRVLSRIFGIFTPVGSPAAKKEFSVLASQLLDKKDPGKYNQAIMDFGATLCTPSPKCGQCVFTRDCYAFQQGATAELPVKAKKKSIKERWFSYFVFRHQNRFGVYERTSKDIWKQLHEFFLLEADHPVQWTAARVHKMGGNYFKKEQVTSLQISPGYRQQLTHQLIHGHFITIELAEPMILPGGGRWMTREQMEKKAFPRMINEFIDNGMKGS